MNHIDYSKLRSIKVKQLFIALMKDSFHINKQKGSHCQFRHPDGRKVTVSFHHAGDTLPLRTLRGIIKDAQWDEHDLRRLKLLK